MRRANEEKKGSRSEKKAIRISPLSLLVSPPSKGEEGKKERKKEKSRRKKQEEEGNPRIHIVNVATASKVQEKGRRSKLQREGEGHHMPLNVHGLLVEYKGGEKGRGRGMGEREERKRASPSKPPRRSAFAALHRKKKEKGRTTWKGRRGEGREGKK